MKNLGLIKLGKVTVVMFMLILLTACGSSGDVDDVIEILDEVITEIEENVTAPPASDEVMLSFLGTKTLDIHWAETDRTDYYKLYENIDGVSGFSRVGGDIVESNYSMMLPLFMHADSQYMVESCNEFGCTSSNAISIDDRIVNAIGYISNPNNGEFAKAVSISEDGSTMAVGVPFEDFNSGVVYIYVKDGEDWEQEEILSGVVSDTSDYFGRSVSLSADGQILAIGAPGDDSAALGLTGDGFDNSAEDAGAVYIFENSSSGWTQTNFLKPTIVRDPDNGLDGDEFGTTLQLSGDGEALVVGAESTLSGVGVAYVFRNSTAGWVEEGFLYSEEPGYDDTFGNAVAISFDGDTIAVGASFEDSAATGIDGDQANDELLNSGAVYVYSLVGGEWLKEAYLKSSNSIEAAQFGYSLSLSSDGSTLAVGAVNEDSNNDITDGEDGAAYLFTRDTGVWVMEQRLIPEISTASNTFGSDVSLSSDGMLLAIGAQGNDSDSSGLNGDETSDLSTNSGAAYVFVRENSEWLEKTFIKAKYNELEDNFGEKLVMSGDGLTLVIVAPYLNQGEGGLFVY